MTREKMSIEEFNEIKAFIAEVVDLIKELMNDDFGFVKMKVDK